MEQWQTKRILLYRRERFGRRLLPTRKNTASTLSLSPEEDFLNQLNHVWRGMEGQHEKAHKMLYELRLSDVLKVKPGRICCRREERCRANADEDWSGAHQRMEAEQRGAGRLQILKESKDLGAVITIRNSASLTLRSPTAISRRVRRQRHVSARTK